MRLFEGSLDKILHSKSRTQCFSKEEFFSGGLSLEAIHQCFGSTFHDFFEKTTKKSYRYQPFWNHYMLVAADILSLVTCCELRRNG